MRDILDRLVAFDTISANPNIALMHYVRDLLEAAGVAVTLVPDATGGKANLYATTGPGEGGVMLSGHTDVVPVEGQAWTKAALCADRIRRPLLWARDGGHEGLCRLCHRRDAECGPAAAEGSAASGAVL